LRIALGVTLIWKGINFDRDTAILEFFMNQRVEGMFTKDDAVFMLVISVLTLLSGIFITAGRFTGITALIQLPIFSVGMLFIHAAYIERTGFELVLTIIVPFLLLFITKGNRVLSNNADFG
jgi:uncharacterized membrane protein YphA (DoxX/SURF4 family)